jgi:epoxide hydrolase-like predicted phosphatase
MTVRAVAFDVGGVLEQVAPSGQWLEPWRQRLGLDETALRAAMAAVDPRNLIGTGRMTEAEYRRRCVAALRLSGAQADEFMADMWDWYCGELDADLHAFAVGLRPRYRTAILSNSADGARREEMARWAFDQHFDPIIYSHEVGLAKPDPRSYALLCERLALAPGEIAFVDDVPANVAAAAAFGIRAVLHRDTAESIAAVSALLAR